MSQLSFAAHNTLPGEGQDVVIRVYGLKTLQVGFCWRILHMPPRTQTPTARVSLLSFLLQVASDTGWPQWTDAVPSQTQTDGTGQRKASRRIYMRTTLPQADVSHRIRRGPPGCSRRCVTSIGRCFKYIVIAAATTGCQ